VHLREALTVICTFAGTHASIPYALFDSIMILPHKVYARRNHPCLNKIQSARILTHRKTYIQALLKHASTYDVGLISKLARPLSYSEACVQNRKIDLTYTCTDAYMDTSFKKRIITNRLSRTHVCKHVLLHELTIAA
jgi:hypothetical protein